MIAELLNTALGPLVGGRAYPTQFAQPGGKAAPTWPAIRYTLVGSDAASSLCGSNDDLTDQQRWQIDVVAETYDQMVSLRRLVRAALEVTDPPCTRQPGGFETYDVETRTHRGVDDFLFQPSSEPESPDP